MLFPEAAAKTPKEKFLFEPTCFFYNNYIVIIIYYYAAFALELREKKLLSIVMINKHTIIENTCLLINNILPVMYEWFTCQHLWCVFVNCRNDADLSMRADSFATSFECKKTMAFINWHNFFSFLLLLAHFLNLFAGPFFCCSKALTRLLGCDRCARCMHVLSFISLYCVNAP